MSISKLYLAGPDVFYPDAQALGKRKKELCSRYGFIGLYPLDNEVDAALSGFDASAAIYRNNLELMREADAIVANISPFRGPNMDPGTAFEVGFFAALGKPVFLYSNTSQTYKERVSSVAERDAEGMLIEDFGDVENLMIVRAADGFEVVAHTLPKLEHFTTLGSFEALLQRIQLRFSAG